MARDPLKPVIPLAVEEDEEYIIVRKDGRTARAAKLSFSEEDVGRMKAGYVCAVCYEPHNTPWPKQCSVCKFPMKEKQAAFLAQAYQGSLRIGPESKLEDELAAMEEMEARQRRKFDPFQIWVPRAP